MDKSSDTHQVWALYYSGFESTVSNLAVYEAYLRFSHNSTNAAAPV